MPVTSIAQAARRFARIVALHVALLLVASLDVRAQDVAIRGFPSDALAARAVLERVARATPDPARIRSYVRAMTAFPHLAGPPGPRRVAEGALARFRRWGPEAGLQQYEALPPLPPEQVL